MKSVSVLPSQSEELLSLLTGFSKKPNLSVLLKRLKNPINYHGQSEREAMHFILRWPLQQRLGATCWLLLSGSEPR